MRVALVHDWLVSCGGAERVLEALIELYPKADIFTSVVDRNKISDKISSCNIIPSFLQKIPNASKIYKSLLPLMPIAFEQFDFSEYDLVISSSHACAKGVITPPETLHICYCHTPMRYAWDMYNEYLRIENVGPIKRLFIAPVMNYLRIWDRASAARVEYFIANSRHVAERIRKFYGRESSIIYPPIDIANFTPSGSVDDYYLTVARLVPQKRVDIIIQAFNKSGKHLKIVGTGRDAENLKAQAKDNIEFLGYVKDADLNAVMAKCKAFVFASYEDFGIVPVEAQAAGRPVIVYSGGGAKESVILGKTGLVFDDQTSDSLNDSVERFETMYFDSKDCVDNAKQYDKECFKSKVFEFVTAKLSEYKAGRAHS